MASVPEGAKRSDDGFYWWDTSSNSWQVVPEGERVSPSAGNAGGNGAGRVTQEELARITSEEHLDERSKPYFQPDADKITDDSSDAEGSDVLSDEPAPDAAGGN